MIHLDRVAEEIKSVGLYDLVLQDVQKIAKKSHVTTAEILDILEEHPQILRDYKQINVEYNIGNIHIKDIPLKNLDKACKTKAETINKNLASLRELEKYTLDFEQSATLVIIFSIEFFVLFSVQYFIVLLDLKEWQSWIYAFFALSVLVAYIYGKKESKKYQKNAKIFEELYVQTLSKIGEIEDQGCVKKSDLIITECEEHV